MLETIEARARELARRAGVRDVPTPVLVAALALVSVAVVAALVRWWPQPADAGMSVTHAASRPAPAAEATVAAVPAAVSAVASGTVCVDVVGAVRHPGVYTLADGTRVHDAVEAAGGVTPSAASAAINLAAKLSDGQQIVVPTDAQVAAGSVPAPVGGAASSGAAGGAAGGGPTSGAKVNVNTADASALDALPGVGPSTAAKIVADRQANGPFRSVGDLTRVPGIGPKKLDQLKSLVCVN